MKTKGVGCWWSHRGDPELLDVRGAAEELEDWRCCRGCWCGIKTK